jgi:glycerol kinase
MGWVASRPVACVLAIDAGTTGVRTLAIDDAGAVVDQAYRPLTQHFPRPGWVEHDPVEIWDLVATTLGEVAARRSEAGTSVAAVGIANQRETAVAWDRQTGLPLHRAIVWQDRRTAARCEELAASGHEPMVRRRTGLVLDPYFTATKYEWLLTQGGVERSPGLALGTVDSWLLWHLTGGPATPGDAVFATDPTNASRTMLFDIGDRTWSEELCELVGVPVGALAEVRPSCGRLGTVGAAAAVAPGLAGVPVSGIAGDQQAALLGQGCVEPGLAKVTYGTGSFLLLNAGPACPEPGEGIVTTVAWDLGDRAGAAPPVAYALEGSTFVAGAAIQWLRDELGVIERSEDVGPLAESVPDSGDLVVVPAFAGLGSPWWDARARGAIVGITAGTGRAQLARAVVEAIAYGVRDMVDAMNRATGRPCVELRADGGASAMRLLLQLQADQLQVPVVRPRCLESTALGSAMLAGLAEGVWASLAELARLWTAEDEHRPGIDGAVADLSYARWSRALERSKGWVAG